MEMTSYSFRLYACIVLLLLFSGCERMDFERTAKVLTTGISSVGVGEAVAEARVSDWGEEYIFEHGHCWSTEINPDISDARTELGVNENKEIFTSVLTGLQPSSLYHVRAYVSNEKGTFYGTDITFSTFGLIDNDGNLYRSVVIGEQEWMSENLKAITYSDGSPLVDGRFTGDISGDITTFYYFAHNDIILNVELYGRLYTAAAARRGAASSDLNPSGVQGVCPAGWHLPSDAEWMELEAYLGMPEQELVNLHLRGYTEGDELKNPESFWEPSSGNNSSGFNALAAGYREPTGQYNQLGEVAYFWTCTEEEENPYATYARAVHYAVHGIDRWTWENNIAYSVRCVKD